MEENPMKQQKYLIAVVCAEEQEDISESMISVESVFEKKQMLENSHELENRVGRSFSAP